jgi:hypothetical protein
MRAVLLLQILLMLLVGCAHRQYSKPAVAKAGEKVITGHEAVAIVQAYIQSHGGDLSKKEWSASKIDVQGIEAEMRKLLGEEYSTIQSDESWKEECWLVTAWHIWYPNNQGSSRFVPGGFTSYFLSADGKILKIRGGR